MSRRLQQPEGRRVSDAGDRRGEIAGAVAVVIPTHQRPKDLQAAVASAMRHSDHVAELVVIDDGRDVDPTSLPPQARLLTHNSKGVSGARNRGIGATTSEFLYFLDDDDELQPNALSRLLAQATSDSQADVVFGRWCTVDPSGAMLRVPATGPERALPHHLATRTVAPLSACLFRRNALISVDGFDPALDGLEDWDLIARLQHSGAAFRFCDHVVARYVDHPGSHSKNWALIARVGCALVKANLRRINIDDRAIAKTLHSYLLVETARRAYRAGDAEAAKRLLTWAGPDADINSDTDADAAEQTATTAARLRGEVETLISEHLYVQR